MKNERCENCRFWDGEEKTSDDPNGLCRRRSPTGLNQRYGWPLTNYNDWCGEFFGISEEPECATCRYPTYEHPMCAGCENYANWVKSDD